MLQALAANSAPGAALANVSLLRLDLASELAPGNKSFKLREYLLQAQQRGVRRLVSFGGPWSNHLHALAAVGQQRGFETVGIVRGELTEQQSAMLADVRRWGMQIVPVSRGDYRRRNDADYQAQLEQLYGPCLLIPEGGATVDGARGCLDIAGLIRQCRPDTRKVVLPVGTGATLAGVVAGLDSSYEVVGISALKGAVDLEQRVDELLQGLGPEGHARWRILHDYHCGGFARTDAGLRDFMLNFEAQHNIPLEPVYTGKMLYAIARLQDAGDWDAGSSILAIHTGGLQGRRGYEWLR